jgi:uncharacterized protein
LDRAPQATPGWAIVTGASSGIGAALAAGLARRGHNLILVSRDGVRLEQQAAEYASRFGVQTRVVAADLSEPVGVAAVAELLQREPLAVRVLVNNAGFGVHGRFAETEFERELQLVRLQIDATLALTKLVLPAMKREGGRILNVASVYSFAAIPNQIVYAACKAFLLSFSRGLAAELAPERVTVTVLCPGVTQTEFRSRAGMREKKSFLSMSAEAVAEAGLRGLFRGRGLVVPGVVNKVYVSAAGLLPGSFFAQVARLINYFRGVAK